MDDPKKLRALLLSPFAKTKQIAKTEVGDLHVSTIFAGDINKYETAVCDSNGNWPVERYDTEEQAKEGHQKWVAQAPTLTVIKRLGWDGYDVPDKTVTLK